DGYSAAITRSVCPCTCCCRSQFYFNAGPLSGAFYLDFLEFSRRIRLRWIKPDVLRRNYTVFLLGFERWTDIYPGHCIPNACAGRVVFER
ncbi:MAG: hypothetical protein ACKPFF_06920, partial [Planktothrix sp.]